ncbi:hypothetical protein EDB85DRAFT_1895166 [Lactarius pseudohatsudake]|nr:hypothetical protein EDB85DRAFT_1895166 [Lactarius pseudohatsudake]
MNNQPESEHEAASTSIRPVKSAFALTLPSWSPTSSTFLPSPVISATHCQPASEPASTSESPVSKFGLSPRTLSLPPDQTLAPLSSSTLSSSPLLEISTLGSLPVALTPDQMFKSLQLDALAQSSGLTNLSLLTALQGESIAFLPASLEAPPNAPTSPCSTPLQQLIELKTIGSVSTQLKVTPSPASPPVPPIPQQVTTAQWLLYLDPQLPKWQELSSLTHEVSSLLGRHLFHSLPTLRLSGFVHFRSSFTLVVMASLVSTLINVLATLSPTRGSFEARKISATVGSAPSTPQVATSSHSNSGSDNTRPTLDASFSILVARLQVQVSNYSRHTRTRQCFTKRATPRIAFRAVSQPSDEDNRKRGGRLRLWSPPVEIVTPDTPIAGTDTSENAFGWCRSRPFRRWTGSKFLVIEEA